MPKINGERLLADLRRIADFGRYETGVHRPHLSPQDVESRHWLVGRMKEAGLDPVIEVDGGENETTAGKAAAAGATAIVAGSAIFGAKDYKAAIAAIRASAIAGASQP